MTASFGRAARLTAGLLLVVAACSSGEGTTTTEAAPPVEEPTSTTTSAASAASTSTTVTVESLPPSTSAPPPSPDPVTVTVAVDEAAAATALIPPEGGSITAEGPAGSRFTLEIPPGALLSPQEVTLTPVATIEGLPLSGGLGAAVSLAPEGLRLQLPAALTIETSSAPARIGFGYRVDGEEFHLYPAAFTPSAAVVQLSHFSGYGTGEGTDADIAAQLERVPTSSIDQGGQAVAGAILQSGAQFAAGQSLPAAAQPGTEDALRNWYEQAVRPRLASAQTDAVLLDDAIAEWDSWWTQVTILTMDSLFAAEDAEARDLLTTAIDNGIDEFAQECRLGDAPENTVFILRWWKLAVSLGLSIGYGQAEIIDIVEDCAQFTLTFVSRLVVDGGPVAGTWDVEATVPLVPDPIAGFWSGSAPLIYTKLDYALPPIPPNCQITNIEGVGSTFEVPFAWLNLDVWAAPPDLRVVFDPGRPQEKITATCEGGGRTFSDTIVMDGWAGNFALMHTPEFSIDPTTASGILVTGFSSTGHMTFLEEYDRQEVFGSIPVTEFTTIEVSPS